MQKEKHEFQTAKHTTIHIANLRLTGQNHKFYIISDSFLLKEDRIFGLPLLQKYDYQITNSVLSLGKNCTLQPEIEIPARSHHIQSIYLDNQLTNVCFINPGNQTIKSKVEIENNIDKIRELNSKMRLDHIRETIRKIITSYKDIFSFEYPLPYNTLTQHKIQLKNLKLINVKSYISPECHKEIHRQINE